jgi:hypothetical protein
MRSMGYGVSLTYGVWSAIFRKPTWWMDFAMGYKELWVVRDMGYGEFDCKYQILTKSLIISLSLESTTSDCRTKTMIHD